MRGASGRNKVQPAHRPPHPPTTNVQSMDADGTGAYFRAMTPDQRRTFFAQERIPFFIRWLLNARIRRFERCGCQEGGQRLALQRW